MKRNYYLSLSVALVALSTSCVDDAYDLSNIDTNAELKVNSLVLPLKVDEVSLDEMLVLDDNSRIKVINGEYVLIEEGEFESDELKLDPIHADAPEGSRTEKYLDLVLPDMNEIGRQMSSSEAITAEYHIKEDFSNYKFDLKNISEYLLSLDKIEIDVSLNTNLKIEGINFDEMLSVDFEDITLHLPKGLGISNHPGVYDPETGILFIDHMPTIDNGVNLSVDILSIDFKQAGIFLDEYMHSMSFDERITLAEGKIIVKTDDVSKLPQQIKLVKECDFGEIDVTSFSGKIRYDFEEFDIAPIDLNGIPSILNQEGTDIRVANPQIYLSINNPAAQYKLTAQTGLKFIAHRAGQQDQEYVMDNDYFTIGCDKGNEAQIFCLSPKKPINYYTGFEGANHVQFSSLGNILSGKGMPSSISVSLVNPRIAEQYVENVELGKNLGKVKGKYLFFSPLALAKESIIVYSDELTGWNNEDLDALTITELEVNTDITSDLPIGLKIVGYPIDKDGNKINNVDVEGVNIDANAKNQAVKIRITGAIEHLDGIRFEAMATADDSESSLKPSQKISLKNIKVRVSGKYVTEL